MKIQRNFSLKNLNSFGIECYADYFSEVHSVADFLSLIKTRELKELKKLIIGGGSNVLFTNNFSGLIINNKITGLEIIQEDENNIFLKVASGVIWHELVNFAVNNNYYGLENLALIPGTVGAAPIQNIGAYGVELKDVFFSLEALDFTSGELKSFSKSACHFGYRDSIFKKELKDKFFITSVTLILQKNPSFNLSYAALQEIINSYPPENISLRLVFETVIKIRKSKLPDPSEIGNAGSFFKNPEVDEKKLSELKIKFPEIPFYQITEKTFRIPAGWLIEKCYFKGFREGDSGVHKNQALVLVNYGNATGGEILTLAEKIQEEVKQRFSIKLTPEVNIF